MTWLPDDDQAEQPDALCAVDRCKRLRSGRWTICDSHGTEVGQFLAAIPDDILDRLDPRLSMQAPSGEGVSGGGLKSHRSVANLDVLSIRDRRSQWRTDGDPDGNNLRSPLEVLHAYATEVREGRGLYVFGSRVAHRLAGKIGPVCEQECRHESCWRMVWWHDAPWRPTVATERKVLRDHLDWCLTQDFAADMWRELRQLDRALAGQDTTTERALPRRVGQHRGCGGMLWSKPAGQGAPGKGWCDGCELVRVGLDVVKMRTEDAA